MTKFKAMITAGTMILAISATSITAFATSQYKTPAEAVAAITGGTLESVIAQKQESNVTYGSIAKDAGKLDEFKAEMLKIKKDILDAQVAEGRITREKADSIIKAIEENQAVCDGTGTQRMGKGMGARFGSNGTDVCFGTGNRGQGRGGKGMGMGGMRQQDGSCYITSDTTAN